MSLDFVSKVLEEAVATGVTPGAVALVRHHGEVVYHGAVGQAASVPQPRLMQGDTIFDLASLTKPLVGAAITLALVDRGKISLDDEVTVYLPELAGIKGKGVTFRRLLTHTSGLPSWQPLYVWARDRPGILETIDEMGLVTSPGTRFEYTDIGFITLGIALERAMEDTLDHLATELVLGPLGLEHTGYTPSASETVFAVNERGNDFEKRMTDSAGLRFDGWRNDFYPGVVHDGNSHYALGGVSAHAGLFSDAHGVGVLGEMWLGRGEWSSHRVLSQAVVDLATGEQTDIGSGRGLGWQLTKPRGPTAIDLTRPDQGHFPPAESPWTPWPSGELLSSGAYGHTGFTGTSLWIDPARELVAVLLTNATHPEVDVDKPLNSLRARFHNAAVAALDTDS